jgi:fatty acid desaturase
LAPRTPPQPEIDAPPVETANLCLLAVALGLSLIQFFLFPLLLLPAAPAAIAALLVAVAILTPLHWGLAHESFHGGFSADAARNRMAGRVLGWFIFMSWDLIRFGHLMHHDANRHTLDRPEVLRPGQSVLGGAGPYFGKLLGGHAVLSFLSMFGVMVPERVTRRLISHVGTDPELAKIRGAALKAFGNRERRVRIRVDLAAILLLMAAAIWAWGRDWPIFAASAALRYAVLSLLDNAPHYGTVLDSGRAARNTRFPRAFRWLVLNQNFHGVHHLLPDLTWRQLPGTFRRLDAGYSGDWFWGVVRQFRGPLRIDQLRPVAERR